MKREAVLSLVLLSGVGAPALAQEREVPIEAVVAAGGSEETEAAVGAALEWLARHQSPPGHWDADHWAAQCEAGQRCNGSGSNFGDGRYEVGLTALATLAFLRRGETAEEGPHRETVARALAWLRRQQTNDGSIGFQRGETIYNHALATTALCEALALGDEALRQSCDGALAFCLEAQNPGMGWKYGVRTGRNDSSVTGAMVLALEAARDAGLAVPAEALQGARSWFERATSPAGAVGYEAPGGGSSFFPQNDGRYDVLPVMNAVALVGRGVCGEAPQALARVAQHVAEAPPSWTAQDTRRASFYYWYYGSRAMRNQGGETWRAWNQALVGALLPRQRTGGCENGSWDAVGEWCLAGGRVYATAINALTLEVYYRH